jgi:hypothetical protein
MVSHLVQDFDDIDPHGTQGDTAAAAHAHDLIVGLDEILEFVKKALAQPRGLIGPGIVPRRMHREIGKLAGVPGANPLPLKGSEIVDLVVDIETMTGRAKVGTNSAAQAAHRFFIPERGIEQAFEFF